MEYLESDEYLEYLKKNCGVRGFDLDERTPVSTRPDVAITLRYAGLLGLRAGQHVLEVGCGVGRIIKELHDSFAVRPHGIDPSEKIVQAARERVGRISTALAVASAERIPYADGSFDAVLCWGVFDLTDQAVSLREMARVVRSGGLLLITGKSDDYEDDDLDARAAEIAARRKGIPNHFTDNGRFLAQARAYGLEVEKQWRFRRRGDFMADLPAAEDAERFYEYAVLLRRSAAPIGPSGGEIASRFSKTFLRTAATA